MPTPDLTKIDLYLMDSGDNFYFGKYKEVGSHYFRLNKDSNGWDIVPFGSRLWDSLDQQAWKGHDVAEWYGEGSNYSPPAWLPPVPTDEELNKIETVEWEDNFKTQHSYTTEEMPNLASYFNKNNIKEKKIYFALTEDTYESCLGDGIFRYLKKISFQKSDIEDFIANLTPTTETQFGTDGFLKEYKIMFDGEQFIMPDFKPLTFEHYEQDALMRVAEELADRNSIKFFNPKENMEYGTHFAITSDSVVYKRIENPHKQHDYIWVLSDEEMPNLEDYYSYSKYEYEKINWGTKFEL